MNITCPFIAMLVALNLGMAEAQAVPSSGLLNVPTTLRAQSANVGLSGPIALSLSDAIQGGLNKNLGVLLQEQEVRLRDGKRWQELADVLPHVSVGVSEGKQMVNPVAFGFPMPVVGPFDVFDARVFASQSLVDVANLYEVKMEAARVTAERRSYESARALVVTSVANLYLQTTATAMRLAAAQARAGPGEVVLAVDRSTGADSRQSRAHLRAERQRVVALQNTFTKQKLALAQAIGLPHGQQFTLADQIAYTPLRPISLDDGLQRAYQDRPDFQAQLARVKSAEARLRSANGQRLPTVRLDANYGKIGPDVSEAKMTFGAEVIVRVPILEGGRIRGKLLEADAELRQQKARLEDLRDAIYYEIQSALLDVQAAEQEARLAREAVELTETQLAPVRDHSATAELTAASAPVGSISLGIGSQPASDLEAPQAEDAAAAANESYVSTLYAYSVAKLALARALGVAERAYTEFLGGTGR